MAAWERAEPMNSSCYGFPFAKHCGALPQASRKACAETAGGRKALCRGPKEGPALLIFWGEAILRKGDRTAGPTYKIQYMIQSLIPT